MSTNKAGWIRCGRYEDIRHDYDQTINININKGFSHDYGLQGAERHNLIADTYHGINVNVNPKGRTDTDGELRNIYEYTICEDPHVVMPGDNSDDAETYLLPDKDSIQYFRNCYRPRRNRK